MLASELQNHYDQMWNTALESFEKGEVGVDTWLGRQDDDRRGITLLLRPDDVVKKEILDFLKVLQGILPEQYFYPPSDIHLTIMSVISCYSGFTLDQIKVSDYVDIISDCLENIRPFSIRFKGVTASKAGLMIQGFPELDQLNEIRECLRKAFKKTKLENSMDKRYKIATAHMTVARFQKPISDTKKMIEILHAYRTHDFGSSKIQQLELVFNDWYQQKAHVRSLHLFDI